MARVTFDYATNTVSPDSESSLVDPIRFADIAKAVPFLAYNRMNNHLEFLPDGLGLEQSTAIRFDSGVYQWSTPWKFLRSRVNESTLAPTFGADCTIISGTTGFQIQETIDQDRAISLTPSIEKASRLIIGDTGDFTLFEDGVTLHTVKPLEVIVAGTGYGNTRIRIGAFDSESITPELIFNAGPLVAGDSDSTVDLIPVSARDAADAAFTRVVATNARVRTDAASTGTATNRIAFNVLQYDGSDATPDSETQYNTSILRLEANQRTVNIRHADSDRALRIELAPNQDNFRADIVGVDRVDSDAFRFKQTPTDDEDRNFTINFNAAVTTRTVNLNAQERSVIPRAKLITRVGQQAATVQTGDASGNFVVGDVTVARLTGEVTDSDDDFLHIEDTGFTYQTFGTEIEYAVYAPFFAPLVGSTANPRTLPFGTRDEFNNLDLLITYADDAFFTGDSDLIEIGQRASNLNEVYNNLVAYVYNEDILRADDLFQINTATSVLEFGSTQVIYTDSEEVNGIDWDQTNDIVTIPITSDFTSTTGVVRATSDSEILFRGTLERANIEGQYVDRMSPRLDLGAVKGVTLPGDDEQIAVGIYDSEGTAITFTKTGNISLRSNVEEDSDIVSQLTPGRTYQIVVSAPGFETVSDSFTWPTDQTNVARNYSLLDDQSSSFNVVGIRSRAILDFDVDSDIVFGAPVVAGFPAGSTHLSITFTHPNEGTAATYSATQTNEIFNLAKISQAYQQFFVLTKLEDGEALTGGDVIRNTSLGGDRTSLFINDSEGTRLVHIRPKRLNNGLLRELRVSGVEFHGISDDAVASGLNDSDAKDLVTGVFENEEGQFDAFINFNAALSPTGVRAAHVAATQIATRDQFGVLNDSDMYEDAIHASNLNPTRIVRR